MRKTVFITGSSSGIGRAAAQLFASMGWNVVATMRHPEKEQTLTQIDNILVTQLDVQQKDTIEKAIQSGIEHFGQIDVLVNNAGYGQFGIFEGTDEAAVKDQFEVNVFGVMHTVRALLPHFRKRRQGVILNVSSGAGQFTLPLLSLYAASKFALEGFSEALSFELSSLNIKVKIIEPGGTQTNFSQVSSQRLASTTGIEDYTPFLAAAGKFFEDLRAHPLVSAEEVASTIYTAATDDRDTLRYVIGNDDFIMRIEARRQMPDQEYVNFIKSGYQKYMN